MNNRVRTREELKAAIQALLIKYHADSAILFGSYARQEADSILAVRRILSGCGRHSVPDTESGQHRHHLYPFRWILDAE